MNGIERPSDLVGSITIAIGSEEWEKEILTIAEEQPSLNPNLTLLKTYPFSNEFGDIFEGIREGNYFRPEFFGKYEKYEKAIVNDCILLQTCKVFLKSREKEQIGDSLKLAYFLTKTESPNSFARNFISHEALKGYLGEVYNDIEALMRYPLMDKYLTSSFLLDMFNIYNYDQTLRKSVSFSTYPSYYIKYAKLHKKERFLGIQSEKSFMGISNPDNMGESLDHFGVYKKV